MLSKEKEAKRFGVLVAILEWEEGRETAEAEEKHAKSEAAISWGGLRYLLRVLSPFQSYIYNCINEYDVTFPQCFLLNGCPKVLPLKQYSKDLYVKRRKKVTFRLLSTQQVEKRKKRAYRAAPSLYWHADGVAEWPFSTRVSHGALHSRLYCSQLELPLFLFFLLSKRSLYKKKRNFVFGGEPQPSLQTSIFRSI